MVIEPKHVTAISMQILIVFQSKSIVRQLVNKRLWFFHTFRFQLKSGQISETEKRRLTYVKVSWRCSVVIVTYGHVPGDLLDQTLEQFTDLNKTTKHKTNLPVYGIIE
jgi:hypothetical protein